MIDKKKIADLVLKIGKSFDEADISLEETLFVIRDVLSMICLQLIEDCNSQELIDSQEIHIQVILNSAFQPYMAQCSTRL